MPQNLIDEKSALGQAMAWCHQATSHYLSQCWSRSMLPYGITSSVGNSHGSASPRPTTLQKDRELLVNFSLILCLWFMIWNSRHEDLQLCFTEFQTLITSLQWVEKFFLFLLFRVTWYNSRGSYSIFILKVSHPESNNAHNNRKTLNHLPE